MAKSDLGQALHKMLDERDDLLVVLQDQYGEHDTVSLVFLDGLREPFTVEKVESHYVVGGRSYASLEAALSLLA